MNTLRTLFAVIAIAPGLLACCCAWPGAQNGGGGQQVAPKVEEKVTRANFNKIRNNMPIHEVNAILGPGREDSRAGFFLNMRWQSQDGFCTIRVTFEMADPNAWVVGKSIVGD